MIERIFLKQQWKNFSVALLILAVLLTACYQVFFPIIFALGQFLNSSNDFQLLVNSGLKMFLELLVISDFLSHFGVMWVQCTSLHGQQIVGFWLAEVAIVH